MNDHYRIVPLYYPFFFFCVVQQILAEVYCFFIKVLYMHKVDSIEM